MSFLCAPSQCSAFLNIKDNPEIPKELNENVDFFVGKNQSVTLTFTNKKGAVQSLCSRDWAVL